MKKQHDLVTYREVLAFSRGEQVERDTLEGRREREMNPWVKGPATRCRSSSARSPAAWWA